MSVGHPTKIRNPQSISVSGVYNVTEYSGVYIGTSLIRTPIIRKPRHPDIVSRKQNFQTLIYAVDVHDLFIRKTHKSGHIHWDQGVRTNEVPLHMQTRNYFVVIFLKQ